VIRVPHRAKLGAVLAAVTMAVVGCGGGGDGAEDASLFETDTVETDTVSTSSPEPATLDPGSLPPLGEARVDVDGETFSLRPGGSIYFTCEISADRITVNYQQTESGDLSFQAGLLDGEWLGNVTFAMGDDNYGGTLPRSGEGLAVGTGAMTYTGTLTHRTYSDPSETREVEAVIAVNCGTLGEGSAGEATAEIGGEMFTFPASGAQSFECEVTPTSFRVLVNRLSLEDKQIQMEGTQQSGEWVGGVYVISGDDRLSAVLSANGAGLEIVGQTLTFTGTFTQTSQTDPGVEREVTGSASVTCP
jgi:hypothetical protein